MEKYQVITPFSQDIIPNFNVMAADYVKYRQGFPEEFFHRLIDRNVCSYGAKVLDIGCGTGNIARGMSKLGFETHGVDIADKLIEEAQRLDQLIDTTVNYHVAPAEDTGLPDEYFDLVIAGQCWHWLNHKKTIAEAKRITNYNAKLVIAYFDWLPLLGSASLATERLIKNFNPHWNMENGTGFYAAWAMQLSEAGLGNIESYTFTKKRYYKHDDWCGRVRATAGIAGSLPPDEVDAFEKALKKMLKENFPEENLCVTHRCFTLMADLHKPDDE